jgi:hypothetical protein
MVETRVDEIRSIIVGHGNFAEHDLEGELCGFRAREDER